MLILSVLPGPGRFQAWLRCSPHQLGQPNQVVGSGRQGEHPADTGEAAVTGLAQAGGALGPAKHLLDALADPPTDRIAGVAGRPLLLARTDARVSRGFDEARARIQAFVAEGADILFLDSPQSEDEMRAGIAACNDRPALAVTSPAGKHFMPGDAELERIGIRIVVYPQDILAASVQAIRAALGGLKGGAKPPMASPAELATAIRSDDYLAQDARWPDPR